jgi:hypothetical protein
MVAQTAQKLVLALLVLGTATIQPFAAGLPIGCYVNTYNDQHLQKHKGQSLTSIMLKVTDGKQYEGFTQDLVAEITVKLRGDAIQTWSEEAVCTGKPGTWKCVIDCDGGGFTLSESRGSMTLINSLGFRVTKDGCGESSVTIEPKPGDRRFTLSKVQTPACK